MADLGITYNVADLPDDTFAPIPAGVYTAMITNSEIKDTKANDGNKYLKLTVVIQGGEYGGRNVFVNMNLLNKNEKAKKRAEAELKNLCNAIGLNSVSNSTQLHNKRFNVKLSVKAPEGNYKASNEVEEYLPYITTGTDTTPW